MNRTALVVVALCAVVVIGGIALLVSRREGAESPPADAREATAAPAAAAGAPPPPAGAPEPTRDVEPAPVAEPEPVATAPELGTLHIDADVEGASVFIDRRYLGVVPVTAEAIAPGPHQINVSAAGVDGISETIDVEPGPRSLTYRLREVRLDARVSVVHRHGIGSCRGVLLATPDGIRYEAEEGDDSFSVALDDLETFEVDYLENALRLQVRSGRRYDFRDPDDNADRLFVFHRDVERARERLAQP